MASFFMRCEALLVWPANRIHAGMVKIPKEGGGSRLVALIHAIIRAWARVRRPASRTWLEMNPSELIWGNRPRYSSSASAFSHNITAEVATLLNEHSVTVMIDMWKCFDTVLLVTYYAMPRAVNACGSQSDMIVVGQGILPGCTHATSLLTVLMVGTLQRVKTLHPTIHPRALVDDATLQWFGDEVRASRELALATRRFVMEARELGLIVQPTKSSFTATAKVGRITFERWAGVLKIKHK
eukprot:4747082-Pyramimonas_sp.AAC.1